MVLASRALKSRERVGLALAWLVLALITVSAPSTWLQRLLPAHARLTEALLPEFKLEHFALRTQRGQLLIEAGVASREFLVIRGQVWAPGFDVTVQTPARLTQRLAVVLSLASALAAAASSTLRPRAWAFVCAWSATLLTTTVPLVLAGEVWGIGVDALSEPSWRALLVSVSGLLLHGGDLLAALVVPASMVLSDHASPWFRRTTNSPSGEGLEHHRASAR